MAILQMPTQTDGSGVYTMLVDLDNVTYQFNFTYNGRDGFWYMNVLDNLSSPIQMGIKIVSDFPQMRLEVDARRPAGTFNTLNLTANSYAEPSLLTLGTDILMLYTEATA